MSELLPKKNELELSPGEVSEKEAWATSFSWGSQSAGKLMLTNRRLVWKMPQTDRFSWEVFKETVTRVLLEPQGLGLAWRYTVLVEAAGQKHRFEIGGEAKAEEWIEAIKQWANI